MNFLHKWGQYATPATLPLAASLLTLSGGLIGAFRPFANKLVLGLGPAVTFAIGCFRRLLKTCRVQLMSRG